jgi:hypothetical protein
MKGLELLVPTAAVTGSTFAWATVTGTSPLRVKIDGETDELPITPDTLVASLADDDRVWLQLVTNDNPVSRHRRAVILGRAGG